MSAFISPISKQACLMFEIPMYNRSKEPSWSHNHLHHSIGILFLLRIKLVVEGDGHVMVQERGTALGARGGDGVVVPAVVHGEVEQLVGMGEHGAEVETGTQCVGGLEFRIAHRDIERIGVVAVADAVDEIGVV